MTSKNTKLLADASEKSLTPWGERIFARLNGKPLATFAREAGVNAGTLRDIVHKVSPGAEPAVKIAQALDVSVEWLITGRESRNRNPLRSADDSEWVELPRYDLHAFTDEGKPEPIEVVPIRRDWLYSHVRRSKRLWLAELPTSQYTDLGIEGDLILCEDTAEWVAQGYYLWFLDGKPLVRHFTGDEPPPGVTVTDEDGPGLRVAARILGTFGLKPV